MLKVKVANNRLPKLNSQLRERALKIIQDGAQQTADMAKSLAPVDTGFLRGSIHVETQDSGHAQVVVEASYGQFVEYGTVKMAAQPYLTPAVELVKPQLINKLKNILKR